MAHRAASENAPTGCSFSRLVLVGLEGFVHSAFMLLAAGHDRDQCVAAAFVRVPPGRPRGAPADIYLFALGLPVLEVHHLGRRLDISHGQKVLTHVLSGVNTSPMVKTKDGRSARARPKNKRSVSAAANGVTTAIMVKMSPALRRKLDRISKRDAVSRSEVVRRMIEGAAT